MTARPLVATSTPAHPWSVLMVSHPAARALMAAARDGMLPQPRDGCWRAPPWAALPKGALFERLTHGEFSGPQWTWRARLAALMALAAGELARSAGNTLWVIREWLRGLPLSFQERENVERLVHLAMVARLNDQSQLRALLSGCVHHEEARRVLSVVGIPWETGSEREGDVDMWVDSRDPSSFQPVSEGGHLWILIGIPASGKSTWAAARQADTTVCMDAIREELAGDARDQTRNDEVFRRAMSALHRALRAGNRVIFDATNVHPEARREPLRIARTLGVRVTAVVFDVPLRICCARNASRSRRVPVNVILRFAQRLITPFPHEYDERIIVGAPT